MSKEVKRYELRIVDRYAGDGTGDIETDARMKQEAKGRYVLFSDYDALLAEREGMEAALREARNVIATALRASAPDWFEADEDIASHHTIKKIDACLQGAQP